jgi:hypothetical protein
LQVDLDAAAQQSVHDVVLRAADIQPKHEQITDVRAGHAGRYGAAAVFLLDGIRWIEPEGVWIGAGTDAKFVIVPDPQTPIRLFLRNGPVDNRVTLQSNEWRETLPFKPGEERIVEVPVGAGGATPLSVHPVNGFRPADVNPQSQDDRLLGVWIETR